MFLDLACGHALLAAPLFSHLLSLLLLIMHGEWFFFVGFVIPAGSFAENVPMLDLDLSVERIALVTTAESIAMT